MEIKNLIVFTIQSVLCSTIASLIVLFIGSVSIAYQIQSVDFFTLFVYTYIPFVVVVEIGLVCFIISIFLIARTKSYFLKSKKRRLNKKNATENGKK